MKVTIDKKVITLEDAQAANELRKEYQGYDKETIETLIRVAARTNAYTLNPAHPYSPIDRIISIDKMEVTKNHYELTIWIECVIKVSCNAIAEMDFDAQQAMGHPCDSSEPIDAFIQVYRK